MKKLLLLTAALFALSTVVAAQTIQPAPGGSGGTPGGTSGQVQYNNSGAFGGFTMSGDATLNTSTGAITVNKTGGVAFAPSATTDTTSASNISSGTLGAGRLPLPGVASLGGVFSKAAVTHKFLTSISSVDGSIGQSQPVCADISDSSTGCTTTVGTAATQNTGTSGATVPLLNGANTWSSSQTFSSALIYGGVTLSNSVTGTGALVLATSPSLTTPTLGAATATTVNGVTIPSTTDTVALLGTAQSFTAAQTNSTAGAASTPAEKWTGTILSGGNGTTNFPQILVQPTGASASSTWSTSGTAIGVNLAVAAGNFIDLQTNGVSKFSVTNAGVGVFTSTLTAGALVNGGSASITWTGRGVLSSPGTGDIQLGAPDAASPVAQTLSMQSVVAGTSNTAGAATLINGSKSTGSGAGGSITLQTTSNTAASTTQNTEVPVLTLDSAQHGTFGNTTNPPTCGTGCASISGTSTDQRMTITTGSAVTAITVNFGKTWVNVPVCISETNNATDLSAITAISTSAVTITLASALTSQPLYMICQ